MGAAFGLVQLNFENVKKKNSCLERMESIFKN